MTHVNEIYKCNVCGNIAEMVHEGAGYLVCCGQPMELKEENAVDASLEKHVPVVEKIKEGYKVKVGSDEHPMTEEHYIEWIELMVDDEVYRQYLNPGDKPEAFFCLPKGQEVRARAYCNLHGLWIQN